MLAVMTSVPKRRKISGARMRDARIDLGYRQKDLAAMTSFSVRAISMWENGKSEPLARNWEVLSQKLHKPIPWLRASDYDGSDDDRSANGTS